MNDAYNAVVNALAIPPYAYHDNEAACAMHEALVLAEAALRAAVRDPSAQWIDLGKHDGEGWREGLHGNDLYRRASDGRWYMLRMTLPPIPGEATSGG